MGVLSRSHWLVSSGVLNRDGECRVPAADASKRQMDQWRERVRAGSELHQVEGCPVLHRPQSAWAARGPFA
jgi:hypothetical protein